MNGANSPDSNSKVALKALLTCFPTLALARDDSEFDLEEDELMHRLTKLPVRWCLRRGRWPMPELRPGHVP
ncbi:hypothetical protein SMC26_14180 [Actinomadura fulvescens]|uniref:Uncharacterized protein n=1 Tax=Actinomadura fulvescens TaxID=46160 RepID=A0ABN3Q230_9ACTN